MAPTNNNAPRRWTLRADRLTRIFDARTVAGAERRRGAILFAVFLLLHIALVGVLYATTPNDETLVAEQEIPVEVIEEPPPAAVPEPPAPPPPPPPKQEQAKPPPDLDMTPAADKPRDANQETVDRKAPDKITQAPKQAPPAEQEATAPNPQTSADKGKAPPAPEDGPAAERAATDKPDAEPIERAEPKPDTPQPTTSPERTAQPSAGLPTIAQMMARLEPIPDYKIAGAAKPAPVAGGTAKPNYLSILYAMITPHFRPPSGRLKGRGEVAFIIDTTGHLLHVGLMQPSGVPALDEAAIAAVKAAAPYPPPPPGMPSVVFRYP